MVVLEPPGTLRQTPSQEDGVSQSAEAALRSYGAGLIQQAGILLRCRQVVMVSAQTIMQRFYFRKSLVAFDVRRVAAAALLLATKLEEQPRKITSVARSVYVLACREDGITMDVSSPQFLTIKTDIIRVERHILREMGFAIGQLLEPPHKLVLQYAAVLECPKEITQKAWGFLNDAMRTTVCCQFEPNIIAVAGISLAARTLNFPLPQEPDPWWEIFDASYDEVVAVCERVWQVYNQRRPRYVSLNKGSGLPIGSPMSSFWAPASERSDGGLARTESVEGKPQDLENPSLDRMNEMMEEKEVLDLT
mmetsp:Transcript_9625/g.20482  ORF Transcript_9625/g.20482 Transcript_9625/m.20482 type:complete len:306 (-) Transcript_9625:32-949(-)